MQRPVIPLVVPVVMSLLVPLESTSTPLPTSAVLLLLQLLRVLLVRARPTAAVLQRSGRVRCMRHVRCTVWPGAILRGRR